MESERDGSVRAVIYIGEILRESKALAFDM
jgi:hypothetical protein